MTRRSHPFAVVALLAMLAGCGAKADDGPVAASVIGSAPAIVDPSRKPLSASATVLLTATAQGLVRFDGSGEIEPGLAMRWDVSDDGLYYTFRLSADQPLDAGDAARLLRSAINSRSRNPLKPLFGAVEEIVAVTPEVVEIRLLSPQPYLLELLAQPEMALLDGRSGTGPFEIAIRQDSALTLRPIGPPDGEPPPVEDSRNVKLRGERPALAVARFGSGSTDLVLGGTFADLALARAAQPRARTLRFDPAPGLFGIVVARPRGFLGSADNRRALAMAIDRNRIAAAFPEAGWRPTESLVAPGTSELAPALPPDWASLTPALRGQVAAGSISLWAQRNGTPPTLRVAMPEGPGARLLFTLLAIGWRDIGIETERVPLDAEADLRLIDMVAPSNSAAWYLRLFSCSAGLVCSAEADSALAAADKAPTAAERVTQIRQAEAALARTVPFLPIAQPLRWSLVSVRLDGFRENPRAIHPLNYLLRSRE